jgi:hypothetical protein
MTESMFNANTILSFSCGSMFKTQKTKENCLPVLIYGRKIRIVVRMEDRVASMLCGITLVMVTYICIAGIVRASCDVIRQIPLRTVIAMQDA